jgi:SRSO17 transposase
MTTRRACPPAPGPLEDYCAAFDPLWRSLAQRRGFRDYLVGLLTPRERNKTITALADAEPVTGSKHPAVQRLHWYLTEAAWDPGRVNDRRLGLLLSDPVTRPHERGVLIVDDSGDRKDGPAMAHVARQYLGSVGKVDQGIVVVTSTWADEYVYWPAHLAPYTPAELLPAGERDPAFATKPQLAAELIAAAQAERIPFAAVVADSAYGDHAGLLGELQDARVPFVLAVKPRRPHPNHPAPDGVTPQQAARALAWAGPDRPGVWRPVTRAFRDGHTERWWAADARLPEAGWGPTRRLRLVVATTDPARLPARTTWYLVTNLPRSGCSPDGHTAVSLTEIVRIYGLRVWVEQGYKQVKHELGWADFQVRSAHAILRHLTLVCCAFSFCWQASRTPDAQPPDPANATQGAPARPLSALDSRLLVAGRAAAGPKLADPVVVATALVARLRTPSQPAADVVAAAG